MKKLFFAFFICAITYQLSAQDITTFILVRHAEKATDGTKDPDLTDEGKARAIALSKLLKEIKVDAIYSTGFKRTRNTVSPLAMDKKLTIEPYEAMKGEAFDAMLSKHKGGTVVVCGHSNTTPWVANYFAASQIKDFEDSDYDNLIVVDVIEKGKAKVTWLTY